MTAEFNSRNEEIIDIWYDYKAHLLDPETKNWVVNLFDIQSNQLAAPITVHSLADAKAITAADFVRNPRGK